MANIVHKYKYRMAKIEYIYSVAIGHIPQQKIFFIFETENVYFDQIASYNWADA